MANVLVITICAFMVTGCLDADSVSAVAGVIARGAGMAGVSTISDCLGQTQFHYGRGMGSRGWD